MSLSSSSADTWQDLFGKLNKEFEVSPSKAPLVTLINWTGNDFVYDEKKRNLSADDLVKYLIELEKENPQRSMFVVVRDISKDGNFNLKEVGEKIGLNVDSITILVTK